MEKDISKKKKLSLLSSKIKETMKLNINKKELKEEQKDIIKKVLDERRLKEVEKLSKIDFENKNK